MKYLKKLIDDGNDVYIVTASNLDSVSAKMNKVLFKYFPFIKPQNVIITAKKQLVLGDILIDDAPHNMGGQYKGFLFTANHNKSITDDELLKLNSVRVNNWKEVYDLIHGYQKHYARFERSFYRLLKNCGIEQTGVHSLRHTFASVLFSQNVDIKTISTLLGHASIKITMDTYVHLMSDTGEQAVEKLNAAI